MTLILVIWFGFGALLGVSAGHHSDAVDRLRCYAEPSITYWDGPTGTRPTRSSYRSLLHCWPKDGCWLASNGDAVCWRVARVKAK